MLVLHKVLGNVRRVELQISPGLLFKKFKITSKKKSVIGLDNLISHQFIIFNRDLHIH